MRFRDLLIMSINNLCRRKLRTVLTVLGVVIGTASIVVMISLGIGLNELTVEQISSYGSLTTIDVFSDSNFINKPVYAIKELNDFFYINYTRTNQKGTFYELFCL